MLYIAFSQSFWLHFFGIYVENYVAFFVAFAFFWAFRRADLDFMTLLNDRCRTSYWLDAKPCYFAHQMANFLVEPAVNVFFISSIAFT